MAYEFLGPRKIVAGENSLASVPAEVRSLKGTRPLIVTDSGIARSGLLGRLTSVLDEQKMAHGIFSEVEPDPDIAVAEKGKRAFVEGHYDLLIAFGGGSSIDAAKTVSFLARNDGGVKITWAWPSSRMIRSLWSASPRRQGQGVRFRR